MQALSPSPASRGSPTRPTADADDELSEAADQEPGGATKCAYCNLKLYDGDQRQMINGRLYHGFCVEDGRRLAIAAE